MNIVWIVLVMLWAAAWGVGGTFTAVEAAKKGFSKFTIIPFFVLCFLVGVLPGFMPVSDEAAAAKVAALLAFAVTAMIVGIVKYGSTSVPTTHWSR